MKDFLQDLMSHTHSLDGLVILKVTAGASSTMVESISDDRVIIFNAKTHEPVAGINGVFGMTDLNKLNLHLSCPEYKDNAKIKIHEEMSNGTIQPSYIRFENAAGDYRNDVRFMNKQMLDIKMKGVTINEPRWDIEFEPTQQMIDRFKFQVSAHTDETFFQFSTAGSDLIINFGELNSHSGSFVCYNSVKTPIKNIWDWPKAEIIRVLRLSGKKTIKFSDLGMLQIVVESNLTEYKYTFKGIRG